MFYDDKVIKIRNATIGSLEAQTIDVNKLFIEKITSLMTEGCRLVDLGTGNGFVLKQILEKSNTKANLTGIDSSSEMIKEAYRSLPDEVRLLKANNYHMPFPNDSIDIITAKNVTNFCFKEISRVLKPNGYFILREYGIGKGMIEIAKMFTERIIRAKDPESYVVGLKESGLELTSLDSYNITKTYKNVEAIIGLVKSYPFISHYSKNDEKIIRDAFRGVTTVTSDPFILVAQKIK